MDALLISFINALDTVTLLEEKNITVHVPVKRTNTILGLTVQIIVSQSEPSDLTRVPLNLLWACFDKTSPMYRKLYRRTSKNPNASMGTDHSWQIVNTFEGVWEKQFYAEGDEPIYTNPIATTTVRGIMHINGVADDEAFPVVVASNDVRNTDPRNPREHESMHENKPAQQLLSDHTTIDIIPTDPVSGAILYGSSNGPVVFNKMGKSDVCAVPDDLTLRDSSTLTEAPYTGMIVTGLTLSEKTAVPVGTNLMPYVLVYGMGTNAQGFRKFLGAFSPSTIKLNGVQVSAVTVVEGNNDLELTVTASGFPSLVLRERITGEGV